MKGLIRYCAMPTRFARSKEWPEIRAKIQKIVRDWGDAPVIPFDVGPYEDFEGNPRILRPRTLNLMVHIKNGCDADALFGISEGTMIEFKDTLDRHDRLGIEREVRVHYGLDPEWENKYDELKPRFGDLFARLRGPNTLIALVGPRAVGKTFWTDKLLEAFPGKLTRVKNTTTRFPRNERDYESYNFLRREEFEKKIGDMQFLEYDSYQGNYYGTTMADIRSVLKRSSGIFAITPTGAKALYERRFEINLVTILMLPASDEVLVKNFERRGINDKAEQEKFLNESLSFFKEMKDVPHHLVRITGDTEKDEERLLDQPALR